MPWKSEDVFETESWHVIRAANDSGPRSGSTDLIVIHSGETPEGEDSAIGMGNWFARPTTKGSTHAGVDGGVREPSTIQYVPDSLVAWGAAGANHNGMHVEIAGKAGQTAAEWMDDYSKRAMNRAANVVAQWAIKYGIPLRWLSVNEVRRAVKGLCTHADVKDAFGKTSHWDPGPNFPKAYFLELCKKWYRHWMSQRPGFVGRNAPDFRVVVLHDADSPVDEGMALVYGKANALKVLAWPIDGVSFETAFLVGAVGQEVEAIHHYIRSYSFIPKTVKLAGSNRYETAELIHQEVDRGYRLYPNVNY